MINNHEFLNALFSEDAPWTHVTDFPYDPVNIPKDKHLAAWKGDYFSRYKLTPGYNQYFTISHFYADETGQARRRKTLFRHTRVIVLDDVKEKLAMDQVQKLPRPAWILETSPGSEQWGYILDQPCSDRAKVENLLDGLVANGLAPDGRDPGMKGVTRYVRLPEGANNKASKLVDGKPFACRMALWEPFNRVSIEDLAAPFQVDLHAPRREARLDGAADIEDHPLLKIPTIIRVKEIRSDGRFDITCPWVHEHTTMDDSGSAIFTNADGTIGFKCHHGACEGRTGKDLLQYIDGEQPGFSDQLKSWQITRSFSNLPTPVEEVSFLDPQPMQLNKVSLTLEPNFLDPIPAAPPAPSAAPSPITSEQVIQTLCDDLRRINNRSPQARQTSASVLKFVDSMPKLDQLPFHEQICDIMNWSKAELKDILKDLRQQWYGEKISAATFYDDVVYVKELNQFYDWKSRIFFTTDAFQNSFSHIDMEARKIALQDGRVKKVHKLDYVPKHSRMFEEGGVVYGNTWSEDSQSTGEPGDIERWFQHFDVIGWSDYKKHLIQWMAFTLRHPDQKINHMLLLGSGEGCGKDFLLYPLTKSMGDNCTVIDGEELLEKFNDYLLSTKYLHINEAELGNRSEAIAITNKLKPLATAPPITRRVNQKGIKPIKIKNIVNASMTTNSMLPVRQNGPSRRFFALWSDLNIRDEHDNVKKEWLEYWKDRWDWMLGDGWKHAAYYLMYQVDLSDFNPGEAPPMTDFLREIRDASKSPMQLTVETFIEKQHGLFKADLLTSSDISDVLRAGQIIAPNDMFTDAKHYTSVRVGMLMKELANYPQVNAYRLGSKIKLWILRNRAKYEAMDSANLFHEYQKQLEQFRGEPMMKVVK
jgi:hypothetical protein